MDFPTFQRSVINDEKHVFSTGKDVDVRNIFHTKTGDSLLHVACRYGKLAILQILVDRLKADVEVSNFEGKKLLHEAAQFSQLGCVDFLIHSCHVQIDPLKRADWTPLMLAATKSSAPVVKSLLVAGANPLLKNKDGWNVFHIACREGHLPILELLLIRAPSAWDTKSKNQRSPLHTAALHGRKEVVLWLLQKCAYEVDAADSCGSTPLMDALRSGHTATASILVSDYKANPCLPDKIGRQAIHLVSQAGQLEAVEFLLGLNQTSVNSASCLTGETPLHTAAKEGQHRVIEALIQYGANVNLTDSKGRTALHIASGSQHAECVKALLSHGAMILSDLEGNVPADLARKSCVKELFKDVL